MIINKVLINISVLYERASKVLLSLYDLPANRITEKLITITVK